MSHKLPHWHKTALAAAATAVLGLMGSSAMALSLGSITVQSALGEPLRAEIDVPEINAEEAASLKASIASPEAFRAAGLDYNSAMSGLQVSLQRRANGAAFIRLTSSRPVNEPFVDMILEASWASGRIVRDYTMLFDPPSLRNAPPQAVALPQGLSSPSVASQPSAPSANAMSSAAPSRPAATVRPPAVASAPTAAAAPLTKLATAGDKQITVKAGDTASKIAMATKAANVSLDQMLVALLRANPDAFINSNINRIKAGSVMNVPTADQALAMGNAEATQTVIAQSRDFNDFRKKFAASAPNMQVAAPDRQSGGKIQARVDDKKPASAAPDKLTLSKGALKSQADADKLAQDRAAKDAAARAAEVQKNIADLARLSAASAPAKPAVAAPVAATAPVAPAPAMTPAASAAPVIAAAAPAVVAAPSAASAPAAAPAVDPTAAPAASAPVKRPMAPVAPVAEPGMLDQLIENPLVPAGAAGLIALLAGFGIYRSRQKKKAAQVDSSFLESRLQPDSFFGASGGQRVDTNDGAATGSSMVYSPSQLDAADDVDPVAEADVYLAYGRDLQAEEILKEALKTNSSRFAIHLKLLEIYAKRRDTGSFERAASDAFKPAGGDGPDWQRVCDLGLSIDPLNPLYQPGGKPSGATSSGQMPLSAANGFAMATVPQSAQPVLAPAPVDLDLDLDFSLDDDNASAIGEMRASEQTSKMQALDMGTPALDMDLGMATVITPQPMSAAAPSGNSIDFTLPTLDNAPATPVDMEDFRKQAAVSFGATEAGPLVSPPARGPGVDPDATQKMTAVPDAGMLEFDLGSLSLDLGDSTPGTSDAAPVSAEDPLTTKLALAEEFSAIGDDDGARALIEEVIHEATGDLKARAQSALSKLG